MNKIDYTLHQPPETCYVTSFLQKTLQILCITRILANPYDFIKWINECDNWMDWSGFEPEASPVQGERYTRFNYQPP